jgi:hypothetical protein
MALDDASVLFSDVIDAVSERSRIGTRAADAIARLLLESEEVLEWSLWFRRASVGSRDEEKAALLRNLAHGQLTWPREDSVYEADAAMLAAWLRGAGFRELAQLAPVFPGRGLFSSEDPGVRSSDAAEQLGRLSYPASWTWSAALAMWGSDGERAPSWIRRAIEWGVSSASAVELMSRLRISRDSATLLASRLGAEPEPAMDGLTELSEEDLIQLGLPRADRRSILASP